MERNYSVIVRNVTKVYRMYESPGQKLMDLLLGKGKCDEFYALKDISFEVETGESVGLIGLNGSGKSTLGNILAGISPPTSGVIQLNGEPSSISISSGLNLLLTGIENIELKGLMMGLTPKQIKDFTQKIIDFADVGAFIYQPVKTYSSGMRARLGFAIAALINPDIMIIDEALSVGDPTFTDKCLNTMNEFRARGKTIFFVSHNLSQVRSFCSKVIWLEYGVLKAFDRTEEVLPMYERFLNAYNSMSEEERREYDNSIIQNHQHLLLKDKHRGGNKQ